MRISKREALEILLLVLTLSAFFAALFLAADILEAMPEKNRAKALAELIGIVVLFVLIFRSRDVIDYLRKRF